MLLTFADTVRYDERGMLVHYSAMVTGAAVKGSKGSEIPLHFWLETASECCDTPLSPPCSVCKKHPLQREVTRREINPLSSAASKHLCFQWQNREHEISSVMNKMKTQFHNLSDQYKRCCFSPIAPVITAKVIIHSTANVSQRIIHQCPAFRSKLCSLSQFFKNTHSHFISFPKINLSHLC